VRHIRNSLTLGEVLMKKLSVTLALMVLGVMPSVASQDLAQAVAEDYESSLADLFVWFHSHPELSFREHETAARLAHELRAAGIEVTEGVGGTGLVGMLPNGDGPLVMVRADMDGLPLREDTGLPYASTVTQVDITGIEQPVMHACGHDVHITSMVGTAKRLVAMKDQWAGTVMFVGQPAEERVGGAKAMLEDGLYERFGVPDYALAFHVSAGEPAGKVMLSGGLIASSADSVDITVYGVGAHGASPHKGKDPVYIAAQIVVALQSLVSRELAPLEAGVVTVGAIHGGTKHNIIPEEVTLACPRIGCRRSSFRPKGPRRQSTTKSSQHESARPSSATSAKMHSTRRSVRAWAPRTFPFSS
jgi:hippurate hydrolase